MPRIQRAFVSLMLVVGSFGLVAFVGASPAAAGPTYANRMESELQAASNRKRVARDRRAVRSNACVDRMAEAWARHLAESNTFVHRRMSTILSRCNRSYVNENIAKYPARRGMTATQVAWNTVQLWMESTGHRHNLLSRKARVIGVGVARTPNGDYWVIVENMAR